MKLADVIIAWTPTAAGTPTAGFAYAGSHPDCAGWSAKFTHTVGACDAGFVDASDAERIAILLKAFHTMVVRDRIGPEFAHEALLRIQEYRMLIAPDIEGAEPVEMTA